MECNIVRSHELHVLRRLIRSHPCKQQCNCVLITHVLSTAESYIRSVNEVFRIVLVIAIPYSANLATIRALQASGIPVYLPESIDETFLCAGEKIRQILEQDETPLLVQEVGGYLAGCTNKLSCFSHFLGIVEDTNNGYWRYQLAGMHSMPILSMAQSPIKDIEDTVIGDSVIYSTERIFREEFNAIIQGVTSGVIGYGKIGTSTAIALKGRESSVSIYDIDPAKCIRARLEGHRVAPLKNILSESDLIIGCTGKTSVRAEDIRYIRDHAVLVSASAKSEEFDLFSFATECKREEINSVVWRYMQKDGRCFYLLNQGTPVNFRDRSILGYVLDMIYSELFLCMYSVAYDSLSPGLQHSPISIHTKVARTWLEVYEPAFANAVEDKIWNYPDSLSSALTHTFLLQTGQNKRAVK
jgi:adenosylhomocysteinase